MDNNSIPEDWKNITDPVLRKKAREKAYYKLNEDKMKSYQKAYRENNKEKIKSYYESSKAKAYYEANKEKAKIYYQLNKERAKAVGKAYRQSHKDILREKERIRAKILRKTNLKYKLRRGIRRRLRDALKKKIRVGSIEKGLGCTIEQLKIHLESKFKEGMSWDNWTKDGWHIDHIKPLSSFDLTDRNQFLQACHYTNLQPLWAKDNLVKGNRII